MVGFDIDKTIQSSAYLLKLTNGRSNYMRLLKLLYLAERLSLQNRKSPISGDRPIAMERGPVPSRTLDMIKGHDPKASQWDAYFSRDNYDILLDDDPGNLALSRAELK
ncbi:MAG: Panacea domain-containing protein, partial [Pirellulales bacterium]